MNSNGKTITILTIIIAVVGIITPIIWDWWSSNSNLTLTHLKTTKLIEKKASIDGLKILYYNNKVNNLSKILFKLQNTGRLPIIEDDLIDILTISLNKGKILNASIENTIPSNINIKLETINNKVQLSFKLLNSKDTIIFGILTDSIETKFNAKARIKNIEKLEIQTLDEQIIIIKDISWTIYIVGFFTLFFFIVTIMLILEIPKKKTQLKAIKYKLTPIHKGESVEIIKNYINNDLSFLTETKLNSFRELLDDEIDFISDDKAKELLMLIEITLKNDNPIEGSIAGFIITSIGLWYVINSIFI